MVFYQAAPVCQEAASLNQGWDNCPGGDGEGRGGQAAHGRAQGWLELAVGYCPDPDSEFLGTEWWDDKLHSRGSSKTWDSVPPSKRKKAPLVSGPYIVYMLQEIDILEDWTAIKKVGPLLPAYPILLCHRPSAPSNPILPNPHFLQY